MPKRIGLLVGDEASFADALIARLEREPAILAEVATIGGTPERLVSRYDVLLDRMSHRIPHYRAYLKAAALSGARVVNDPMRAASNDQFFALSLAARLGVPTPRAVLLPQKRYAADIAVERELKNLEYPLRWHDIVDYVKLPALVRPAHQPWWDLEPVGDMGALFAAYDASGEQVMVLQQYLEGERYVRCVCVGGERMVPLETDRSRRSVIAHEGYGWLSDDVHAQLERDALALSRALGYALNAVDMVIKGETAWVIEASQPVPDLRPERIGEAAFHRLLGPLAGLLARAAHGDELAMASA